VGARGKLISTPDRVSRAFELLDVHYEAFWQVAPFATETGHPVPVDTRGWSQVIVSVLTGTKGLERKKGPDLEDGSDVKGANTWEAIDTPRFNGVLKAGTQAEAAGTMASLDGMPHLYFVLWDTTLRLTARCRIWVVRPKDDPVFRAMCAKWYANRLSGVIKSNNFQLHPPRGLDSNVIRNTCGNLS
jgi:MamI restriction endonuclease